MERRVQDPRSPVAAEPRRRRAAATAQPKAPGPVVPTRVELEERRKRELVDSFVEEYQAALTSGKDALRAVNAALKAVESLERRARSEGAQVVTLGLRSRNLLQTLSAARERIAAALRQGDRGADQVRRLAAHPSVSESLE